jgi:hypothetical protein
MANSRETAYAVPVQPMHSPNGSLHELNNLFSLLLNL